MSKAYTAILGPLAAAGLMMASMAAAHADVYQLTIDNCSGGCNPGAPGTSMGTITVTQTAAQLALNEVQIDVALVSPLMFINTGLHDTIDFNIIGTPTIALVSTSNTHFSLTSTTAGSLHFDGFGNFEYALQLDTAQGAGGAQPSPESFVIGCVSCGFTLTPASFNTVGTGASATFGVDVINPTLNTTGPIGTPAPILGAGLPGLLAACGGLLALGRRRRQKLA